jgi:hypothetical protein
MKHGNAVNGARTAEYRAWESMRRRCESPVNRMFRHYGGRGIAVCQEWRASFERFLADVGPRPGEGYSLDRIDTDGDYRPGNVRWADRLTQQRNRRNNVMLTLNGVTRCEAEWATLLGIGRWVLSRRLRRGWTVERALTTPLSEAHQRFR